MDNLTHTLVGLTAAKAGLERTSPYATALCVVAANAPDADVLTLFAGRFVYLEQHRGISHSIIGTLALALILPVLFYFGDFLAARFRPRHERRARFGGLLLSSLILSASHPLLDWTNNYGVRPLLPWDGRWFYGDLVFIMDPWIWLLLGGAAFLLTAKTRARVVLWATLAGVLTAAFIFLPARRGIAYPVYAVAAWLAGLCALVLAYRKQVAARLGSSLAVAALALLVVYWGALAVLHARALHESDALAHRLAMENGERVARVAAMPVLANPLAWRSIAETDRALYLFDLSLTREERAGAHADSGSPARRFEKPQGRVQELARRATADAGARVLLEFARFPVTRLERNCAGQTLIQISDLRFDEPAACDSIRGGSFAVCIPVAEGAP